MLPFGLRSAPKILIAVADALHWYLGQRGITCLFHYLDDFVILAPPQAPCCQQDLSTLLEVCAELGVPIANHKTEGPASCLVFLGTEVDTVANELRLPEDKLRRLQTLLEQWGDRRTCTRRELESLVGLLNHACKVVPACKVVRAGRSFLRRMLDLLHSRPPSSQGRGATPIRLNVEFRADLAWWQCFVKDWNGVSFLPTPSSLQQGLEWSLLPINPVQQGLEWSLLPINPVLPPTRTGMESPSYQPRPPSNKDWNGVSFLPTPSSLQQGLEWSLLPINPVLPPTRTGMESPSYQPRPTRTGMESPSYQPRPPSNKNWNGVSFLSTPSSLQQGLEWSLLPANPVLPPTRTGMESPSYQPRPPSNKDWNGVSFLSTPSSLQQGLEWSLLPINPVLSPTRTGMESPSYQPRPPSNKNWNGVSFHQPRPPSNKDWNGVSFLSTPSSLQQGLEWSLLPINPVLPPTRTGMESPSYQPRPPSNKDWNRVSFLSTPSSLQQGLEWSLLPANPVLPPTRTGMESPSYQPRPPSNKDWNGVSFLSTPSSLQQGLEWSLLPINPVLPPTRTGMESPSYQPRPPSNKDWNGVSFLSTLSSLQQGLEWSLLPINPVLPPTRTGMESPSCQPRPPSQSAL